MFKVGDIVVSIEEDEVKGIKLYDKYGIIKYTEPNILVEHGLVSVRNDYNAIGYYYDYKFISLLEYRKRKIEKICQKLIIK